MSHPEFVDNLDGNTLERALRERIEYLLGILQQPPSVSMASGYFNPAGFGRLADLLERTAGVRLLLGAEPLPPARMPERQLGEPRGERYETKLAHDREADLVGSLRAMRPADTGLQGVCTTGHLYLPWRHASLSHSRTRRRAGRTGAPLGRRPAR